MLVDGLREGVSARPAPAAGGLVVVELRGPLHQLQGLPAEGRDPRVEWLAQAAPVKAPNAPHVPCVTQVWADLDEGHAVDHHRARHRVLAGWAVKEPRDELCEAGPRGHRIRQALLEEPALSRAEAGQQHGQGSEVGRAANAVDVDADLGQRLHHGHHEGPAEPILGHSVLQPMEPELEQAILLRGLMPQLAGLCKGVLNETG
mmetsp:Transcript_10760/g.33566  ORF Transcript_10760/g.33566 Transcript_10760/m.33566 type:complete len:203 (+) Transcript_10760:2151-2759(+)